MRDQAIISKGIDWISVWLYIILVSIGVLCIFSVEYHGNENVLQNIIGLKKNYSRQLLFIGISAIIATFILLTDSKFFTATANLSYVIGILLMMATFVLGKDINGSRSWIPLGFFNLQPVETCKIFTALALSKYLSRPETNFQNTRSQFIAAAIALTPAVFSLLQNETGLALVYFAFVIPMYQGRSSTCISDHWFFICYSCSGNHFGRKKFIGTYSYHNCCDCYLCFEKNH